MSAADASGDLVVGIDLGGTKIAASAVDEHGAVHGRASAPTPGRAGASSVIEAIADLVASLECRLPHRIRAVGIGSAGIIDPRSGVVLGATDTITEWAGTRLADEVTRRTGHPSRAINDVHAHALGEHHVGSFAPDTELLLVAVGTGIGGSHLRAGQPHTGTHSAGGHVGHVPSPFANGIDCSCSGVGHAEATGSGPGILATYLRAGGRARDTREVADRAEAGELRAHDAIELSARTVGSLVGGLVNTLDPHVVVISGGVPGIGERWWAPFREQARRELLPSLRDIPLLGSRGGDAACIGASRLWFPQRQDET